MELSVNMRSKEVTMQVKKIIMILKKSKNLVGLLKSMVGYILKKQMNTGKLESVKQLGRLKSTSLVDEQ